MSKRSKQEPEIEIIFEDEPDARLVAELLLEAILESSPLEDSENKPVKKPPTKKSSKR